MTHGDRQYSHTCAYAPPYTEYAPSLQMSLALTGRTWVRMRLGRVAGSPVQWEQWRNVRLNKQGVCWRTEAALPAPPHSLQPRGGEGGRRHRKALNTKQHFVCTCLGTCRHTRVWAIWVLKAICLDWKDDSIFYIWPYLFSQKIAQTISVFFLLVGMKELSF